MKILGLSGSLRAVSSNTALLRAAAALAPAGVEVVLYAGLGDLPHFNPDVEENPPLPPAVEDLRARVGEADGLLISCPEYAHGVPGAFKNALDWLVGGPEFVYKPVALLNASPRSSHAQAALAETVTVMSGRLVSEASIPVPLSGRKLDAEGIAASPELAELIRGALAAFAQAIEGFRG
ncbi:MAG TPA: NADPH-dependent FMN reductase [Thermoanaerobaculia bacterium]|jgi:NAD(P)H-dependent FMN reductase|nr:NADPH-dependent FMN reductase [Thermoanaerobaculia bacterium]